MKVTGPTDMRKSRRRVGTLALVATLYWVAGCTKAEKEATPVVDVKTTAAVVAPITETIATDGVVFPLQQAILTPKITSTIRKFLVQRGSKVRKGQLLVELENADLAAAAEQSKAELEQARAGYATTTGASIPELIQKAELDAAAAQSGFNAQEKVYESRKELFQQGALPRRDLDAAEVGLAQARTQNLVARKQLEDLKKIGEKQALRSATGQLDASKSKYDSAQAQLSYSRIYSPIEGVVTDRPLFPGELAAANQPLITVMNTSKVIAKAHIPQGEAVLLAVGTPAELHIAGMEEAVQGKVSLVSPALDPGSTTIEIWVESVKPNAALRPGMGVGVSISAKTVKDAVVVPTAAVFKNAEGEDYVVLVTADSHAKIQPVKIGLRNAQFVQIEEGVKAGDPVVTSGGYALPDKTQVKAEEAGADDKVSGKGDAPAADKPGEKDKN